MTRHLPRIKTAVIYLIPIVFGVVFLVVTKGGYWQTDAEGMHIQNINVWHAPVAGYMPPMLLLYLATFGGAFPLGAGLFCSVMITGTTLFFTRILRRDYDLPFWAQFIIVSIFTILPTAYCLNTFIGYDQLSMCFAVYGVLCMYNYFQKGFTELKFNRSLAGMLFWIIMHCNSRPNNQYPTEFFIFIFAILLIIQYIRLHRSGTLQGEKEIRPIWRRILQNKLLKVLGITLVIFIVSGNLNTQILIARTNYMYPNLSTAVSTKPACSYTYPLLTTVARIYVDNPEIDLTDVNHIPTMFDPQKMRDSYSPQNGDMSALSVECSENVSLAQFLGDFLTLAGRYPSSTWAGYTEFAASQIIPFTAICPYQYFGEYGCQSAPGDSLFTIVKFYAWKATLGSPSFYLYLSLIVLIIAFILRRKISTNYLVLMLSLPLANTFCLLLGAPLFDNRYTNMAVPITILATIFLSINRFQKEKLQSNT